MRVLRLQLQLGPQRHPRAHRLLPHLQWQPISQREGHPGIVGGCVCGYGVPQVGNEVVVVAAVVVGVAAELVFVVVVDSQTGR